MRCRQLGPSPLFPGTLQGGHHWSTTHHPPAICIGFVEEGQRGRDTKEVLGAWSGWGVGGLYQHGELSTEVKRWVWKEGKQCV